MTYIHVKKIGNKSYYSLRISIRKGNKVITKDLCNLGSDISKISLDLLEKKYKNEIRNSYKTIKKFLDSNYYIEKVKKLKLKTGLFLDKGQLIDLEAIKLHYNSKFLKLDDLTKKEAYDNFLIKFAVNSTSIEGNTISMKEAQKLFRDNITPKNKELREVYDLTNTKKVIDYIKEKKPVLNLNLIIKIHDMLLEHIDKRKGLRTHDLRILGQPFEPSPARYVKADMELLLKWYNKNKKNIHPLSLGVFFHHKFENIHPFSDGNGRTGRIILNYILEQNKFPPLIIENRFRSEYLDAMNKADLSLKKSLNNIEEKHYRELLSFVSSQFKFSYWDTFLF